MRKFLCPLCGEETNEDDLCEICKRHNPYDAAYNTPLENKFSKGIYDWDDTEEFLNINTTENNDSDNCNTDYYSINNTIEEDYYNNDEEDYYNNDEEDYYNNDYVHEEIEYQFVHEECFNSTDDYNNDNDYYNNDDDYY